VGAGVHIPERVNLRFTNLPAPIGDFTSRLKSDTGYIFTGAGGYKWPNGWRTELEVNWRRADVASISGTAGGGRQSVLGGMANVVYDFDGAFDSAYGLTPYFGGGVGIAHQEWKNVQGNLGVPVLNDEFDAFQWQLIGGLNVRVSSRAVAFAEYRFISIADEKIGILAGSAVRLMDQQSHNVILGLRFFF
jgi:opacity protein-like surface antigen